MSEPLDPGGNPVIIGQTVLSTPGLAGTARTADPTGTDLRSLEESTPQFEAALANEHLEPQETIEIVDAYEVPVGGDQTRSTTTGEPAMVLQVPSPGSGLGQVVLAQDEAGVLTWNFPRDEQGEIEKSRSTDTLTYVIRRHVPAADTGTQTRGLLGAAGKKLLKVLVFPLVDPLIEAAAERLAGAWEQKKRPYALRTFTLQDMREPKGSAVGSDLWTSRPRARALMLLHGTFSRAHAAFGRMPEDLLRSLHEAYEGRVVAFDHFTLSHDPKRNAEELARLMPGADLEVDIICHSRGGLVARVLAERPPEGLGVSVRRVVFVATPNAGTVLADGEYMSAYVDRFTTLLNFFPDNGVTDTLEAIITVVKQLAVGSLEGLDGLKAMRPGGPFLSEWLNNGGTPNAGYFALASNYEPADAGLAAFLRDGAMDRIFKNTENDLVVPTAGVHEANGSGCFPIQQVESLGPEQGVHHSGFFASPRVAECIGGWLAGRSG